MTSQDLNLILAQADEAIARSQKLRADMDAADRAEALRVGRIAYASAGAVRQK